MSNNIESLLKHFSLKKSAAEKAVKQLQESIKYFDSVIQDIEQFRTQKGKNTASRFTHHDADSICITLEKEVDSISKRSESKKTNYEILVDILADAGGKALHTSAIYQEFQARGGKTNHDTLNTMINQMSKSKRWPVERVKRGYYQYSEKPYHLEKRGI